MVRAWLLQFDVSNIVKPLCKQNGEIIYGNASSVRRTPPISRPSHCASSHCEAMPITLIYLPNENGVQLNL